MTAFDDTLADDLVVRRVDRVDFLDVFRTERVCFSEPRPYSAFEMFVDKPTFPIAARGDGVLGYVVVDAMPNHGNDTGRVKGLAVRPEVHGNGLGRQLLVQSLTAMAIAGATVVKLEVYASNDPTVGLHQSLGFEPIRRVPSCYGNGEDAHVMVLDVAEWQYA